jgi:hypothetical protein
VLFAWHILWRGKYCSRLIFFVLQVFPRVNKRCSWRFWHGRRGGVVFYTRGKIIFNDSEDNLSKYYYLLELVNLLRLGYSYNHAINVSFIIIHNTTNIKLKLIITCMANRTFKLFTTTNHGFSKGQLDKNVYIDQKDVCFN